MNGSCVFLQKKGLADSSFHLLPSTLAAGVGTTSGAGVYVLAHGFARHTHRGPQRTHYVVCNVGLDRCCCLERKTMATPLCASINYRAAYTFCRARSPSP